MILVTTEAKDLLYNYLCDRRRGASETVDDSYSSMQYYNSSYDL